MIVGVIDDADVDTDDDVYINVDNGKGGFIDGDADVDVYVDFYVIHISGELHLRQENHHAVRPPTLQGKKL